MEILHIDGKAADKVTKLVMQQLKNILWLAYLLNY